MSGKNNNIVENGGLRLPQHGLEDELEHIEVALKKAHALKGVVDRESGEIKPVLGVASSHNISQNPVVSMPVSEKYATFSDHVTVQLDYRQMERNRIVAHAMTDPSYVVFNIMRTKIRAAMADNNWKSIAVTSPGPECGKTMVAVNFAFSLARQEDCKTVLVDLDLRRPSLAKTLGLKCDKSVVDYLKGRNNIQDCFVKVSQNLIMVLNDWPIANSSEYMLHQRCRDMTRQIMDSLNPDIVIFDLPPMLVGDDAMAFMPNVDSSMLVVADEQSTLKEIDECDSKLSGFDNFLGVILNKSAEASETNFRYQY